MKLISLGLTLFFLPFTSSALGQSAPSDQPATPAPSAQPAPLPTAPTPLAPTPAVVMPVQKAWPLVVMNVDKPEVILQVSNPPPPNLTPDDDNQRPRSGPWQNVCIAPCDARADPSKVYRVVGRGLVASNPFQLPNVDRRVEVKGHVADKGTRIIGIVIGCLGTAGFAWSSLAYLTGGQGFGPNNSPSAVTPIVISGAAAVLGFVIAGRASTSVKVE
jgi:hypothetical protein